LGRGYLVRAFWIQVTGDVLGVDLGGEGGLGREVQHREGAFQAGEGPGRAPRLTVAGRLTRLSEDIYADTCYRWSWADPICPVNDPRSAAHMIALVLCPSPAVRRG
jgi:hypothetical protein